MNEYQKQVLETCNQIYLRYTNRDGIVTVSSGTSHIPGEGNGLLQTGLFFAVKDSGELLTATDRGTMQGILEECKHKDWPIFWRSPWKKNPGDDQKADDYWAIFLMLYLCKSELAAAFYEQAQKWAWFIDIQNPGSQNNINFYFDRFPGFRISAKIAASARDPDIYPITYREHLELALAGFWKAWKIDTSDGLMRDYCFFSLAAKVSPLVKAVGNVWLSRVRKKHGSLGKAFEGYFLGPAHPITWGDWHL